MTSAEERLNKVLHSLTAAVALSVTVLVLLFVASDVVRPFPALVNHGIALPSPNLWADEESKTLADFVALVMVAVVAVMMGLTNHRYKMLRTSSVSFCAIFLVLEAMTPSITTQLTSGPFVATVVLAAVMLMLASYNRPRSTYNVFLSFVLLSFGALWQVAFLPYMVAMSISLLQMRIFRLKPMLAALLGSAAPWWTLWCFGLVSSPTIEWSFSSDFFTSMPRWELIHLIISVVFIVAFGIALSAMNIMRIINANTRMRAYNGLLILLSIFTTALIFVDYDNCAAYLTMLNVLVAFQAGHFMQIYDGKRICNIGICSILAIAFVMYFWALWI